MAGEVVHIERASGVHQPQPHHHIPQPQPHQCLLSPATSPRLLSASGSLVRQRSQPDSASRAAYCLHHVCSNCQNQVRCR